MKKFEGVVKMLGNANVYPNGNKKYSVIEIGNHALRDVKVNQGLDNYLQRALEDNGQSTLWITKDSGIAMLMLPNGQKYVMSMRKSAIAVWIVVLLISVAMALGGAWFGSLILLAALAFAIYRQTSGYFQLPTEGAIKL